MIHEFNFDSNPFLLDYVSKQLQTSKDRLSCEFRQTYVSGGNALHDEDGVIRYLINSNYSYRHGITPPDVDMPDIYLTLDPQPKFDVFHFLLAAPNMTIQHGIFFHSANCFSRADRLDVGLTLCYLEFKRL